MNRQNPVLTILGFIYAFIFIVGLLLVLIRTGGKAFSPGSLSASNRPSGSIEGFASHSAFEGECSRCHKPFESTQDELCLACHTSVADQIKLQDGTHGRLDKESSCAQCHPDHRGSAFDLTKAALDNFDHSVTQFSLDWHQFDYEFQVIECDDCHLMEGRIKFSNSNCSNCHAVNDAGFTSAHIQVYGGDCITCHDGRDRMVGFDHHQTHFPLEGSHEQLSCNACHNHQTQTKIDIAMDQNSSDLFKNTPTECVGCHIEPHIHQFNFSTDCAVCHTTTSWSPVFLDGESFAHATNTRFTLSKHQRDFTDQPITCNSCHLEKLATFELVRCIECHAQTAPQVAFLNEHEQQFGQACLNCHDGVDRMSNFNHDDVFQLDGRHAQLACENCHGGQIYASTPRQCVECHREPAVHQGFFGLKCHYCHDSQAWVPASLSIHSFPLDHGSPLEIDCKICHLDRYTEYTCFGCHEHDEVQITEEHVKAGINIDEIADCIVCHPTGHEAHE